MGRPDRNHVGIRALGFERVRSRSSPARIVYWVATGIVVAECLVGGTYDLFRLRPFFPILAQLGYPAYLSTILGIAKILAGIALTVPGFARLKEWAYAGIMINMLGAAASWVAIGHGPSGFIPPLAFAVIALVSWATRPPGRRLSRDAHPSTMRATQGEFSVTDRTT